MRGRRWTVGLTGLLATSLGVGCGPKQELRPFDPSRAIETEKGYRQDGQPLDTRDLWRQLREEPGAARHVRQAEVIGLVSIAFAATGGALIGWSLGEAATGEPNPHWELAAIGGGALAVSIPLTIWGQNRRRKAVSVHNAGVQGGYYRIEGTPFVLRSHSVGVVW